MELRYVSRQYVTEWLLESQLKAKRPHEAKDNTEEDKEPRFLFQARPWRNPEGVVNVRFLHQILHCLLSHLIKSPGITLQDLMNKFNPDLLPMTVLELVQILVDLGCIHVKIFKQTKRKSLFERRSLFQVTETPWIHEGYRVLDMDVTASLRFALFLGHLQTHPGWPEPTPAKEQSGQNVVEDDSGNKDDDDSLVDKEADDNDDDKDQVEGCQTVD